MARLTLFSLLFLSIIAAAACTAPTPASTATPAAVSVRAGATGARQPPAQLPAVQATQAAQIAAAAQVPKYHFVMVSHIGSADPNMLWFTFAIQDFQKRFPEVKIDYLSTEQFSVDNLVALLRRAIAGHPDGIVAPIVSAEAEGPLLRDAISQDIPVIAVNSIPSGDKTIPYLVYVGGDQYKDGVMMAQALLDAARARKIPALVEAVCINPDIEHQGLVTRCRGFSDTMAKAGVKSAMLNITSDAAIEGGVIESYLAGHPNVNAIFSTTARTAPVIWKAAKAMNLSPDVDGQGVTIVSADESPVSLEGVKAKHLLATFGQGFYLQGFTPFEILFFNRELGYLPTTDVLSGPIVIDATNVDNWIPLTRNAFDSRYDVMAQGAWE